MLQASQILWSICRLKSNPQDLTRSWTLLFLIVLCGIVIDSFSSSLLIPHLTGLDIIQVVILYNLMLLSSIYVLLKIIGYVERGLQTITAISGTGLCISLVLLPALLVINTDDKSQYLVPLIFIDNVWRIVVNAHILRHSLSVSLLMAFIISISYLMLGVLVADFLLPAQTS